MLKNCDERVDGDGPQRVRLGPFGLREGGGRRVSRG